MPINKRRYGRIEEIIYDSLFRQEENLKYRIVEFNENLVENYIYDYTDYVILSIVNDFSENKIDRNFCYKLVDKVEGYYYAFEEGFIDAFRLYNKLTEEIMIEELHKNWNYIAIYEGD